MRRIRAWLAPVALVAWTVAACDVKVAPPPTPATSTGTVRKTPAPAKTPPTTASTSPNPGASPEPSSEASAAPSTAPSGATSAPPSVAPSVAPAGGDGDLMWIDGLEPLVAAPDGTVPKIVMWARTAPELGITAYHDVVRATTTTGAVTMNHTVTYDPDPAEVEVTLVAPPGSPGTVLSAYEVTYEYTTASQQAAGKPPIVLGPTLVPTPPLIVPPAPETKAGPPLAITVPIGAKALADLFTGGEDDVPGLVVATVEFKDDGRVPVPNRDLNPLKVSVPIRMMQGAKPVGAAPAAPAAPAPPALEPLAAGPDGTVPRALGVAGVAPAAGFTAGITQNRRTEPSGAVFVESTIAYDPAPGLATIWLTAAPNGPGTILGAYELTYRYVDPGSQLPVELGPVLVPLAPRPVHAGRVTAVRVPITSLAVDRVLTSGLPTDAPKQVVAQVTFVDENGAPVPGPDLDPLKVSIPINVE